jgi:hypothetical protein
VLLVRMVVKVKLVAAERSYLGGKHVAAQVTAIGQHGFRVLWRPSPRSSGDTERLKLRGPAQALHFLW